MKVFDWKQVCPFDMARRFPPIVGPGRGKTIEEARIRRELQPPRKKVSTG